VQGRAAIPTTGKFAGNRPMGCSCADGTVMAIIKGDATGGRPGDGRRVSIITGADLPASARSNAPVPFKNRDGSEMKNRRAIHEPPTKCASSETRSPAS